MRLQRYIALCGVTSRRKAEKLISDGRIKVNGETVTKLGTKVRKGRDEVRFDGAEIRPEEDDVYIILNKPLDYVTTLSDEFNRPIVMDLVKEIEERIYPVGRLDIDTTGLLLLTNDGGLTNKLTHPRYEVEKTYLARVQGSPSSRSIEDFKDGLDIDGRITAPAGLEVVEEGHDLSILKITIHEGRNRQVRRMCSAIGHEIIDLKRVGMGGINLGNLKLGSWRYLSKEEIRYLKELQ